MTRGTGLGGLSREVWLVQVGIFLNALGWGAVLPFEVIYLHDGRGLSLGTAGLVVGTLTGTAVVTAPLVGPLIDRLGPGPWPPGPAQRSRPGTRGWPSRTPRPSRSRRRRPAGPATARFCPPSQPC